MVDRIKIDRSFVFGIETSEEQQTLTASMIAMARALGIAHARRGRRDRRGRSRCCAGSAATTPRAISSPEPMSQAETFGWLRDFHARAGLAGTAAAPACAAAGDPNMP